MRYFKRLSEWYGHLSFVQQLSMWFGGPTVIALLGAFTARLQSADFVVGLIGVVWIIVVAILAAAFAWPFVFKQQPLDLDVELEQLHAVVFVRPISVGATGQYSIYDLSIVSHEERDLNLQLSLRSPAMGERKASVGHRDIKHPGIPNSKIEIAINGEVPQAHLGGDIPLKNGEHVTGCAEFLVWTADFSPPNFDELTKELEFVAVDLRSRRKYATRIGRTHLGSVEMVTPQSVPSTSSDQP